MFGTELMLLLSVFSISIVPQNKLQFIVVSVKFGEQISMNDIV
uniref:Uncharacterized protein n=1 Tax=Rhizophora mucronata TaxID=61149 RepID=A0A2P2JPR9_RHIMU